MTKAETRRAAKVMLDGLKKGAVVQWSMGRKFGWIVDVDPNWNWFDCDYRIQPKKKRRKAK